MSTGNVEKIATQVIAQDDNNMLKRHVLCVSDGCENLSHAAAIALRDRRKSLVNTVSGSHSRALRCSSLVEDGR